MEVLRVALEPCLSMWKGMCAVVLPRLAIQAPLSLGLHCKITLIWPDKALSLIPVAQA